MASTKNNKKTNEIIPVSVSLDALSLTDSKALNQALTVFDSKLRPDMKKLVKATMTERKGSWDFAESVVHVIDGKLFDSNFKNQGEFAAYVGISGGRVSQLKKACEYVKSHSIVRESITVDHAYQLSRIDDMPADFVEWASEKGFILTSDKGITEAIKAYKARDKKPENNQDENHDDSQEDKIKKVTAKNAIVSNGKVMFEIQGRKYIIPEKELIKYLAE